MQYTNHHFLQRRSPDEHNINPIHPSKLFESDVLGLQEALPISSERLKSVEAAGVSHTGYVRTQNEDCFFLKTQLVHTPEMSDRLVQGVFVLCDGMGGFEQGEVASSMATFWLAQDLLKHGVPEFTAEISLKSSLYKVNQDIYQENVHLRQLGLGAMGTTAVAAVLQDRQMSVAHIGDSRCYRVTASGGLEQLTTDHERGQVQISQGMSKAEAYATPDAFSLTQALGPHPNRMIVPDVSRFCVEEDSLFLLCSDGLSDHQVIEANWPTYLSHYLNPETSISNGVQELVDLGLQHNGHDNITALLVRVCLP